MLGVPGLSCFCDDAKPHSGPNSSKGGYEVVWEKFGRRAESLAVGVIPRGRFDPMSHYLYLPGHP